MEMWYVPVSYLPSLPMAMLWYVPVSYQPPTYGKFGGMNLALFTVSTQCFPQDFTFVPVFLCGIQRKQGLFIHDNYCHSVCLFDHLSHCLSVC